MEERIEQAVERHAKGYNCAQAVACTYCDLLGVDEETVFKMTEGLGYGMGGAQATCGAVTGACVLAGMKNSCGDLENPTTKKSTYGLAKQITEEFECQNGSLICKDLKGIETGTPLRSCPDCIRDGAALAEKILFAE